MHYAGADYHKRYSVVCIIKSDQHEVRTHHIHTMTRRPAFQAHWERLLFRDYLTAHPEVAAQYARLKKDLASAQPNDRLAYTVGKTDFILSVMAKAKKGSTSGLTVQPFGEQSRLGPPVSRSPVRSRKCVDDRQWKWYSVGMDKTHTAVRRMSDKSADDLVPGTPVERIGLVWPLTREAVSLSKRYDAERRLQRHVANLGRRGG